MGLCAMQQILHKDINPCCLPLCRAVSPFIATPVQSIGDSVSVTAPKALHRAGGDATRAQSKSLTSYDFDGAMSEREWGASVAGASNGELSTHCQCQAQVLIQAISPSSLMPARVRYSWGRRLRCL
ncbi:hypothetical protein N657DRAFT_206378 [Parathielavia appendiculata]|uniref:Uncharacterized protein n=1 Tax=Parathielavia appendiculata TaxID=2587402 RepID=A0AAN6Z7D3_9PEZI|nr:hypothetical protein N657DRAFT_206378 [Parathielavia appendiculata]